MELPILKQLPLPETAVRMVTQFLRKPHPTAAMIKELHFDHYPWGFSLYGEPVRYHRQNAYPPRFCKGVLSRAMKVWVFDKTGELEIPVDDDLNVDELRAIGFGEDEIAAMGFV